MYVLGLTPRFLYLPYSSQFSDRISIDPMQLACARAASPSVLQAAHLVVAVEDATGVASALNFNGSRSAWSPLVDGVVIPEQPSTVGLQVPSILGSNAVEGALFVLAAYGEKAASLTQADYDTFLTYNFGPLAPLVNETFSLSKVFNGSVAAAVTTVVTDASYKCAAHRGLLRAAEKGVPVWSYRFSHGPSCAWFANIPSQYVSTLGATHTSEIPFVFNMTRNMPPPDGNCTFSEAEVGLSRAMSRAWTNMAEFGVPEPDGDGDSWPLWTADESMGVVLNDDVEVGEVDYETCAFWNKINDDLNKIEAVGQ